MIDPAKIGPANGLAAQIENIGALAGSPVVGNLGPGQQMAGALGNDYPLLGRLLVDYGGYGTRSEGR